MTEETKTTAADDEAREDSLRAFLSAVSEVCADRCLDMIEAAKEFTIVRDKYDPGTVRFALVIGNDHGSTVICSEREHDRAMKMLTDIALSYQIKRVFAKGGNPFDALFGGGGDGDPEPPPPRDPAPQGDSGAAAKVPETSNEASTG